MHNFLIEQVVYPNNTNEPFYNTPGVVVASGATAGLNYYKVRFSDTGWGLLDLYFFENELVGEKNEN